MSITSIKPFSSLPTTLPGRSEQPRPKTQTAAAVAPAPKSRTRAGEAAMLHAVSNALPHLSGIAPALYHSCLSATRDALIHESREQPQSELGKAMGRAAHFLEEERRLLEVLDTYRNLLHQG